MTAAERAVHTPPPSLVPRLHAVVIRKLAHNNPLLPHDLSAPSQGKCLKVKMAAKSSAGHSIRRGGGVKLDVQAWLLKSHRVTVQLQRVATITDCAGDFNVDSRS